MTKVTSGASKNLVWRKESGIMCARGSRVTYEIHHLRERGMLMLIVPGLPMQFLNSIEEAKQLAQQFEDEGIA